jgi:hypothetical protein
MRTPPANDGSKAVLLDTDHLWGIGGDVAWVWRAFLNGHQPLYMDPLDGDGSRDAVRRAMGMARRLAERVELATLAPRPELAGSGCCLATGPAAPTEGVASTPRELVAWSPRRRLRIDLRDIGGVCEAEWLHPATDERVTVRELLPPQRLTVVAPWPDGAVLYLRRSSPPTAPTT